MFLSKFFKFTRGKALIAFAGLAMVLGVTGAISTVAATQQNEVVETKATTDGYTVDIHSGNQGGGKWENNWWTSSIRSSANSWNNLARDTSDNSQVVVKDLEVAVNDSFYGHTWYERWSDGSTERWEKGFTNQADDSNWDNSSNGDITCKTAGVYTLYYVPNSGGTSNGWTFVNWGTVTVNLYYVDSSGSAVETQSSTTTTSQNDFAAPTIPNVEGYTKPTVWRIGDREGETYTAQRITVATYNLYAVYTAAPVSYTVTLASTPAGYGSVSPTSVRVPAGTSYSTSTNELTIGDTVITATPAATTAQYSYSFSSWSSTSGTIDGNVTITATFERSLRSYTVTIAKNESTYGTVSSSSVSSVPYGTTYSTLGNQLTIDTATPTVITATPADSTSQYTYAFSGWSSASGTIMGATTITANFTRTGVSYDLTLQYWNFDGTSIKETDVTPTAFDTSVSLDAPAISGYHFLGWYESADFSGTQRDDGYDFNMPDSNKVFTAKYAKQGYYVVGNAVFSNVATEEEAWSIFNGKYLGGTPSGTDHATGLSIPVPVGSEFKVLHYIDGSSDSWCQIWGSVPTNCDATNYGNCTYGGTSPASFNFYVNFEDWVYVVDNTVIDSKGYLYIASASAAGDILVTTKDSKDGVVATTRALSAFTGATAAPSVTGFDSCSHLYRVPIYNLRGDNVTTAVAKVVWNDGDEKTITGIPDATNTPHLYGSTGAADSSKGAAAKLVFDLAAAIDAADDDSLCAVSGSNLRAFLDGYSTLNDSTKTFVRSATIYTYTPTGNSYDEETKKAKVRTKIDVSIGVIYDYVSAHYNTSTGKWTSISFGPASREDSPLTLTLWIVLGAGILGMGAIGTAYFVSKKKKRHQA